MSQYKAISSSKRKAEDPFIVSTENLTENLGAVQFLSIGDWAAPLTGQWKKALEKHMSEPETNARLPEQLFNDEGFLERFHKEVEATVEAKLQNRFPQSLRTQGSLVYDELQKKLDLETNYKNKFVAIDTKSKQLIAEGSTLEEVYTNAFGKTKSRHLYFRKVGRSYLLRA